MYFLYVIIRDSLKLTVWGLKGVCAIIAGMLDWKTSRR